MTWRRLLFIPLTALLPLEAQPTGVALDHFTVAARDHDACTKSLASLGFRLLRRQKREGGSEHSFANFRNGGYLEIVSFWGPVDERGKAYVEFLKHREGVKQVALEVQSLEEKVRQLRQAGLSVGDANSRAIQVAGQAAPVQPSFWTASIKPAVDSLPLFFIQYRLGRTSRPTEQDNGVTTFRSATIVVRDLPASIRTYAAIGTVEPQDREFPMIGAIGRVVALGNNGILRLVTPKGLTGMTAQFLREQGEGVWSIGMEVQDRAALAAFLNERNVPFELSTDSLVVAPEHACGVRFEFQ